MKRVIAIALIGMVLGGCMTYGQTGSGSGGYVPDYDSTEYEIYQLRSRIRSLEAEQRAQNRYIP